MQGDPLERERIAGIETERGGDAGDAVHFLHGGVCAADFHGDFCCIVAKAVAVDLHGVAAGVHAGVGEELQDLRTVAEGVRGDGEPAVLEIGGQVEGAVGNAWGRARLDLSGA